MKVKNKIKDEKEKSFKLYKRECMKAIEDLLVYYPDEVVESYKDKATATKTEPELITLMGTVRQLV